MRRVTITELIAGRRLDTPKRERNPEVEYKAQAKRRRREERNIDWAERVRKAAA